MVILFNDNIILKWQKILFPGEAGPPIDPPSPQAKRRNMGKNFLHILSFLD